jgi:Rod binding domain-containing protein
MSELSSLGAGIPTTAIPADVKKAGTKAEDTYKAALGFEQMLVKQLTKSLSDSSALGAGKDGEDGEGSSGSPAVYRDMVADQMAASITNAGGMGIARSMYDTLSKEQS